MIFDRTQEDIEKSRKIIDEKVKKFIDLSYDEINILSRATLTAETLNRIEDKQNEIKGIINNMGYWDTNMVIKRWKETSLFFKKDFERILNNIDILRNAFFENESMPKTPTAQYKYTTLNDVERILYEMEVLIDEVKRNYLESGDAECGQR